MLVVKVKDANKVFPKIWSSDYIMDAEADEGRTIFFELPEEWQEDFRRFAHGRYSWFSDEAIEKIRANSGLTWNLLMEENGQKVRKTDARLKVFTKDADLKERLEHLLGTEIDEDAELMEPPKASEFWDQPV